MNVSFPMILVSGAKDMIYLHIKMVPILLAIFRQDSRGNS